jgi:regulator of cell morphogenesis and NO signaling
MFDIKEKTVGEVVAEDYRTAFVFKSFGIDYCCGGKRNVENACTTKNVDVDQVEKELRTVLEQPADGLRFNQWSAGFLVDYIINNHHRYVRTKLPELIYVADKVARVHSGRSPELVEMLALVRGLDIEMIEHLNKEEKDLFPVIKEIENSGGDAKLSGLLLRELEDEHELAGGIMQQLEELSNGFTPPSGACTSYVIYFKTLKEFQEDLHMHVHLENNVLFPKVLDLVHSAA